MTIKDNILNVINKSIENESFFEEEIHENISFKSYFNYEQNSISLELCFYNENTIIDNIYSINGEFKQSHIEDMIRTAVNVYKENVENHLYQMNKCLEEINFINKYFDEL